MKDGLYRVETSYFVAGFVIKNGLVLYSAPILRKKMQYWKTVAKWIGNGVAQRRSRNEICTNT